MSTPHLTITQTIALLRASMEAFRAEVEAIGDEACRWHAGDGEWCINEVLGHMIEAEQRGFAGRIAEILERPGLTMGTWDPEVVARERGDCQRQTAELLQELASLRDDGLRVAESIRQDQLDLSGEHVEVGRLQISDVLHEWVFHDRAHLEQVLKNTQAYVWSNMGNARRFSVPE